MGRVGNGDAEEDWQWDLKPGVAATRRGDPCSFGQRGRTMQLWQGLEPHGFGVPFAAQLRKPESKM